MRVLSSFFTLLVVSTLTGATDVPATQEENNYNVTTMEVDYYPCYMSIEECYGHLLVIDMEDPSDRVAFLSDRQRLEEFAESAHNTSVCLENVVAEPPCSEVSYVIGTMPMWTGFLNSPGVIDAVVAASGSVCVVDEDVMSQVESGASVCAMSFVGSLGSATDLCADFYRAYRCIRSVVAKVCGQPAGDLVRLGWNYMTSPGTRASFLQEMGLARSPLAACAHQVDVLKRSASDFMPLIKKMKK